MASLPIPAQMSTVYWNSVEKKNNTKQSPVSVPCWVLSEFPGRQMPRKASPTSTAGEQRCPFPCTPAGSRGAPSCPAPGKGSGRARGAPGPWCWRGSAGSAQLRADFRPCWCEESETPRDGAAVRWSTGTSGTCRTLPRGVLEAVMWYWSESSYFILISDVPA